MRFPPRFAVWSSVRRHLLLVVLALGAAGNAAPPASPAPLSAKDAALRADAAAAVNAAVQPLDQAAAFLSRSKIVDSFEAPTESDRRAANDDAEKALRLVNGVEKASGQAIDEKALYYFQYACSLARIELYTAAIKYYNLAEQAGYLRFATTLPSKGAELWGNRGSVKLRDYDYAGALADLDIALTRYPGHTAWMRSRAEIYFQQGDLPAALAEWKAAEAKQSSPAPFPFDRAFAPYNRAVVERPTEVDPAISRVRYLFSKVNKDRKDPGDNPLAKDYGAEDVEFAQALKPVLIELDRTVKNHPDSAAALVEQARVRLVYQAYYPEQTGRAFDFTDTVKDLAHALELEPSNAAAWFELGLAHLAEWRTEGHAATVLNILMTAEEKAAAKKAALTSAVHAFSRAIHAQPDASGLAHLERTWAKRALDAGGDLDQTFIDADAAIAQNFQPTDPAWDAVLHPARTTEKINSYLADAYYLRGKVRISRGESTAGVADLDQALTLDPTNNSALFERGKAAVRRGAYAAAITDLSALIAARPKLAEGWLWRGVAHDGAGEIELASADLGEATQHDDSIRARLKKTRYDIIEPNPSRGIAPRPVTTDTKSIPTGTALEHKNAGNALRGKGDSYGAQREYTFAVLIDPTFADAFNNRGSIYQEWQEFDLAMVELTRAITLDSRHRVAYLNRGFLWRELGDHEREREDFDHAVEYADVDSRRAEALLARGHTFENARDRPAAEADYLRATQLAPGNAATWNALAYIEGNQGRYAEAVPHFRKSLELNPDNFHSRVVLAISLALLDDVSCDDELETALEHATRDQIYDATSTVDQALESAPKSARLQGLRDQIKKKDDGKILFV